MVTTAWVRHVVSACIGLCACAGTIIAAADSTSSPLAKQLTAAMTSRGLDAIAARDPDAPDVFVAALVFPGSQLLVVSAPYSTPAALDALLAQHQYRDVYSALQQPSIKNGKIFVQDLGCDGLRGEAGADVDVVYEQGTTQTMFDGNWKAKRLSEAAYRQKLDAVDVRYAHLLTVLLASAGAPAK